MASDSPLYELVYNCGQCGTQFEAGVADSSRDGVPRCPQCGLTEAHPIKREQQEEPSIIRKARFLKT
jgi:putative FmdB family regulatory protein